MSDQESRLNELSALESIFNAEEIRIIEDSGTSGGQFYAHPDVSPDFKIIYRDLRSEENEITEVMVMHLPPLVLYFSLPNDYPSKSPPNFSLSCKWLKKTEILRLCRKLDELWEENKGMEILFLWTQFLKEESLKFLGYEEKLDVSAIYTSHLKFLAHRKTDNLQNIATESGSKENVSRGTTHKLTPSSSGDREKRLSKSDTQKRTEHSETEKRLGQNESEKRLVQNDSERRFRHHAYGRNFSGRGRRGYRGGWRYQRNWENRYEHTRSAPPESSTAGKNDNKIISQNENESPQCILKESTEVPVTSSHSDTQSDASKQHIDEDTRAILDISPLMSVVRVVTEYNKAREEEIFKRNFYTCKICFQDKLGAQSTKFEPCGHVFCRDCISSYLEVRIKEGTVHHIGCPEDKCTSEATAIQVQGLVSQDLFLKYDSVLLNAMLDSMEDVIYCPRGFCQYPTTRDPNEKMATCPACNYVFCIYCKMVYHGVEPCRYKTGEKLRLVQEYQSADAKQKEQLEQRYGRRQLQLLVDNTMSEAWISTNSKNCPNCNAAIEKSDGCNKMVCWRCNTYFCWICSARLNPQCPYLHFSSRTSNCFNMLFHGAAELEPNFDDDDDEENEIVGAYIGLVV